MDTTSGGAADRSWRDVARWFDRVRVVAIAAAGVLELARGQVGLRDAVLFGAASLYVAVRFGRPTTRRMAWVDALVAAVLVAVTGGMASSYVPLSLVTVGIGGFVLGTVSGIAIGALATFAGLANVAALTVPASSVGSFLSWIPLHPLAGAAGGMLARVRGPDHLPSARALEEANELLRGVHDLAREVPRSLDLREVASAILEEVSSATSAPAAVLFAVHDDRALAIAAEGVSRPRAPIHLAHLLEGGDDHDWIDRLDPAMRADMRELEPWYVTPLVHKDELTGVMAVAVDRGWERHSVDQIAEEAAISIDNARIFASIRQWASRSERQRLVRELHDGIAQTLAHVLLEVQLAEDETGSPERLGRLSKVVREALEEVRETVSGLRTAASPDGIVATLREHLETLSPLTEVDVRFEARGAVDLPPGVQHDAERIAEEAVWNALRHADASTLVVELDGSEDGFELIVTDDGRGGAEPVMADPEDGDGLRAMRERARAIDSDLRIRSPQGVGTQVRLRVSREREG